MRVTPSLLARDLDATLAFYGRLGFEVTGRQGGTWAEVSREGASLWFYTEPPEGTPTEPSMSGTVYFHVAGVEALARSAEEELLWGPEVMEYGMREFGLRDPNGYLIAFTEPA